MDLSFINLEMDEETRKLIAETSEIPEGIAVSESDITEFIHAHGYLHFFILKTDLTTMIRRTNEGQSGRYTIAEKRNAELHVLLSADKMEAFAEISPPQGGTGLTRELIDQALEKYEIKKEALVKDVYALIQTTENNTRIVIARGMQPVRGKKGYFEWLINDGNEEDLLNETTVDDPVNRIVDYRAGKTYSVVDQGTPILLYHQATKGIKGFNVLGAEISTEDGKDVSFDKNWKGIEQASGNPNIYVSSFRGHPVNLKPGARVDKTLTFRGVNLDTGHVEFDGSVEISGDVEPTMKINVTGDVLIKGTVEKAEITAGNNITITGGILGEDHKVIEQKVNLEFDPDNPEESQVQKHVHIDYQCVIKAGGTVEARFSNISKIDAKKINIREYAFHSSLTAKEEINLGQEGGKGMILGGLAKAGRSIRCNMLGNETYTATSVLVGATQEERQSLKRLKAKKKQYQEEAQEIVKVLTEFKKANESHLLDNEAMIAAKQAKKRLNELKEELHELIETIQYIADTMESGDHEVEAKNAFRNVDITIDGVNQMLTEDHKHQIFIAENNKITVRV